VRPATTSVQPAARLRHRHDGGERQRDGKNTFHEIDKIVPGTYGQVNADMIPRLVRLKADATYVSVVRLKADATYVSVGPPEGGRHVRLGWSA